MSETILAGRYRLIEKIGEGGMAHVYRAVDQNTGRDVAIKVMKSELSQDADYISRFQREAEAASKMTHHNIVNLTDVGMEGSDRFLVMEYVPGKTLKQVIQEKGRISPNTAAQIAIRILSALQHAHQNGIIHRDIKPQNILVAVDGHIKVADFGIARIANSYTLTRDDSVMGTVYYYSPEQASGQKVGATSDIYSVGIVLYEMLTGRVPFDSDSQVAIAMQHLHAKPTPIEEIVPDVPPAICHVCMKAMAKDPHKRYQSAREMAAELCKALEGKLAVPENNPVNEVTSYVPEKIDSVTGEKPVKERPVPKIQLRQMAWWGVTALMAVLLMFGLYVGATSIYEKVVNSVTVPDLTGIDVTQAERKANRYGLDVEIVKVNHPSISAGIVAVQMPGEGSVAHKGDSVLLTVSQGPVNQGVPRVVGLTLNDAISALGKAGLTLTVVEYVATNDVQANFIISQVPEAHTRCNPGDVVQVTVSGGLVNVPKVEGMRLDAAGELLKASGLTVSDNVTYVDTPDASLHGQVAAQSPASGSPVLQDTTVYLTVYQTPGQTISQQVILDLPQSSEAIDVRVTVVKGSVESTVYSGTYAADAPRRPGITLTVQMPGDYVYKVYCNNKFVYQQNIKME